MDDIECITEIMTQQDHILSRAQYIQNMATRAGRFGAVPVFRVEYLRQRSCQWAPPSHRVAEKRREEKRWQMGADALLVAVLAGVNTAALRLGQLLIPKLGRFMSSHVIHSARVLK